MHYEMLSEKQKAILSVIRRWLSEKGFPPTIRDIGGAVGISSTSVVNYNLNKLVEGNFIIRSKDVSRGIRLNEEMFPNTHSPQTVQIPLLGPIAAGKPLPIPGEPNIYADEDLMQTLPRMLIGNTNPNDVFALHVQGYSMIDAMINDGDIVILKRTQTARNGEMVAAWLTERGETTLKHFYAEGERVRLQPANPTMDPIYVDKNKVEVQGKVLAVLRRMS